MESEIFVPLVFHAHQPVGNLDYVIEDCYQKSYKPLIEQLHQNPELQVTLHFSGNLLEWLIKNKPEFIDTLKVMARRGQLEMLSGGYYEPIFAIIPYRDKIAQIKKLSVLIYNVFGLTAKGAWLPERVWEPHYPSFLSDAGIEYILIDDNHLRSCGLTEEETFYSYMTENDNKKLRIFPINETLRYLTPWKPTYYAVNYLEIQSNQDKDRVAVFFSDMEKMGAWASTYQFCYQEGRGHIEGDNGKPFIPAFFEQINNNPWIKSITLMNYVEKHPAKGLIYLPSSSYDMMEVWALPSDKIERFESFRERLKHNDEFSRELGFVKAGFWRHFLVKYPEANNMHKKMLHVREKLVQIEDKVKVLDEEVNKSEIYGLLADAIDEIHKSQCNDSYWHGFSGGLYLQFLRFEVYSHLIKAENLINELNQKLYPTTESYISVLPKDFNKNGKLEMLIESSILNMYLDPSDGGTIFEIDYKPKAYNLLNTLTRWKEPYHKDEFIKNDIIEIDDSRRSMLRVRFFDRGNNPENLYKNSYHELGDFLKGDFNINSYFKERNTAIVKLERKGNVQLPISNQMCTCIMYKNLLIEENQILITIKGKVGEETQHDEINKEIEENLLVGIDLPFFLSGDDLTWDCSKLLLEGEKSCKFLDKICFEGNDFEAYDKTHNLAIKFMITSNKGNSNICKFPLYTLVLENQNYKKIYQGLNLLPVFNISPSFEFQIQIKVEEFTS